MVDAKFLDSYIAFGIMVGGSIAALVWAFTQGIGWVEISVFVGTFAHEHDRHRLHASLLRPPQLPLRPGHADVIGRDRHDGGAGLGAQMGLQPSPAPSHSDKPGDVHSPYYDGDGNRHVSFVRG